MQVLAALDVAGLPRSNEMGYVQRDMVQADSYYVNLTCALSLNLYVLRKVQVLLARIPINSEIEYTQVNYPTHFISGR